MTQVVKISIEQKNLIEGKEFAPDSYFNPILDQDNEWVISKEEMEQASEMFSWVKQLPQKQHKPKVAEKLDNINNNKFSLKKLMGLFGL